MEARIRRCSARREEDGGASPKSIVDLHSDDRLNARLRELFREFERTEEVVGVGDGERRHVVGLGELRQRLDRQRPFAQREGAVHVQMHEADGLDDGGRFHWFDLRNRGRARREGCGQVLWIVCAGWG